MIKKYNFLLTEAKIQLKPLLGKQFKAVTGDLAKKGVLASAPKVTRVAVPGLARKATAAPAASAVRGAAKGTATPKLLPFTPTKPAVPASPVATKGALIPYKPPASASPAAANGAVTVGKPYSPTAVPVGQPYTRTAVPVQPPASIPKNANPVALAAPKSSPVIEPEVIPGPKNKNPNIFRDKGPITDAQLAAAKPGDKVGPLTIKQRSGPRKLPAAPAQPALPAPSAAQPAARPATPAPQTPQQAKAAEIRAARQKKAEALRKKKARGEMWNKVGQGTAKVGRGLVKGVGYTAAGGAAALGAASYALGPKQSGT